MDASGTLSGAGGVGGLVMFSTTTETYFPTYDGNGNVTGLVNGNDGTVAARYEYGPFGNLLRMSGSVASANHFRFSSKWQDDQSDLLYYGFRWYDPISGRWLSRDLLEERGALNLYSFVHNRPTMSFDVLGNEENSKSETAAERAKEYLEIYKDAMHISEDLIPDTPAWVDAVGENVFTIGYGVAANILGDKLKALAQKEEICNRYITIRFEHSSGQFELSQSALVQKAPPSGRNYVLNSIDDSFASDAKRERNGFGYLPFVWGADTKMLLFVVWSDEDDGQYANVSIAPYQLYFNKPKPIRPVGSGEINIHFRCSNHCLVAPRKR